VTISIFESGGNFTDRSGSDGTFVRNLAGLNGETTMKMISITSRTSMSGVTLMLGFGLALGKDECGIS
jgi:hypothetical protein